MSIIQRWISRQAAPLLEEAARRGRLEGLLASEQWVGARDFELGALAPVDECGTRQAYEQHVLFTSAVQTVVSLVLGTGVTYGELDDPRAMQALEEWYALNDLENLSKRIFTQWLLDGELLLLIAQDAGRNEPAWLNLWDTVDNPIEVRTERGNPRVVTGINLGRGADRDPESFVWRAHTLQPNAVRGVSPLVTAVQPSVDFTRLMNLRMRAHEIRGRLNAVLKLMAETPEEFQARAGSLGASIPRAGNLLKLHKNPKSGESDEFEFANLRTDAADAESDYRMFLRAVAMVFGIPEHFLSVGETGNRATADAMAEPMARKMDEHQTFLEGALSEAFRKELVRRFGPNELFTVNRSRLNRDGTRDNYTEQVPANKLHIPFDLPPVRQEDSVRLDALKFGYEAGLLSRETVVEELGFDPALELERSGSETPESDS